MIRSMYKATAEVAAALMLIGATSSVYGFTGSYSTLTRDARKVQITGRVICTSCTMDEARMMQPKYSNHLYRLTLGGQPILMEVYQTTNATWLNHLMQPHIRVRGEDSLLRTLSSQDTVRKDVTIVGQLLDAHTVNVQDVTIHP